MSKAGAVAEAAGFGVGALQFFVGGRGAGDGGVGGDNAGELMRAGEGEDFVQGVEGKVGGDFDEDGLGAARGREGAGLLGVDLLHGGEDVGERGLVLELAEVGGVRRADIDDEEIGEAPQDTQGVRVIFGGFFERGDFGFAEVDADGVVGPAVERAPFGKLAGHFLGPGIVETHAVDEGFVGHGAEHARRRIAGLRVPGDAAEFAEAEAKRGPDGRGVSVFVHAGGETDGVGKAEAEEFDGQLGRAVKLGGQVAQKLAPA